MKQISNFIIVTTVIGILLGVLTSFGQTFFPDPFKQLANSYSVWLFFSLVAGYMLTSIKKAALAGVLLQYVAILLYYVASSVRFDMDYSFGSLISLNLIWIIGGTIVGPVVGVGGALIRQRNQYIPYAIAFTAALFISEGLYQFLNLHYVGEGIVFTVVALVFLAVCYYRIKYSVTKTILSTTVFSLIMYVGYAYVLGSLFN